MQDHKQAIATLKDCARDQLPDNTPRKRPDLDQWNIDLSLEQLGISLRVHLRATDSEFDYHAQKLSTSGLWIMGNQSLRVGAPVEIQCTFGEIAHMKLAGQVINSQANVCHGYVTEIRFAAIREWERMILHSAIQAITECPEVQEASLVTITISEDILALETSTLYTRIQRPSHKKPRVHRASVHASQIVGWGAHLPSHEVTNNDINSMLSLPNTNSRFGNVVGSLTGIRSRRYAESGIQPSDLAVQASRKALQNAGMDPADLEVIISCGVARDVEEPATACIIQEKLGAYNAYAFDLSNACNGFISGLDVLDSFIASGRCHNGLVAVGEVISQYINWKPDTKTELRLSSMGYTLGDGGGAAVLTAKDCATDRGITARWFLTDSSYWPVAVVPLLNHTERLFRSNGAEVEKAATEYVPQGIQEILKMLNWDKDDLALVIPHQVSAPIIEKIFFDQLRFPEEKVFWSFPDHGNVGAASMPVALCKALEQGLAKPGDKILLVGGSGGFGAGILGVIL